MNFCLFWLVFCKEFEFIYQLNIIRMSTQRLWSKKCRCQFRFRSNLIQATNTIAMNILMTISIATSTPRRSVVLIIPLFKFPDIPSQPLSTIPNQLLATLSERHRYYTHLSVTKCNIVISYLLLLSLILILMLIFCSFNVLFK